MKILDNLELIPFGIIYKDNLIIGDLHIGLEEAMNKQGILIPRFQLDDLFKIFNKIFSKRTFKRIIINGDLKHEFGEISKQEWRDTLRVLDYLLEKGEVILIKGNHDTILDPIANKKNLKIIDKLDIDNISIVHGDKIKKDLRGAVIIGHVHPAINLEGRKYKCFLKGKYKEKDLIVLPSFNLVNEGYNVLREKSISPYMDNSENFEVYVVEDKVYYFGKVENLKKLI